MSGPEKTPRPRARRLFDLRSLIGGLLLFYGLVLVVVGLTDGPAELARADGIRINLWTGLAMAVVGVLFLVWERFGGEDSRTRAADPDDPGPDEPEEPPRVGGVS